jgi:flagella basal body P-ring formation protein FlgA
MITRVFAFLVLLSAASVHAQDARSARVEGAIADAIRSRMGADAQVIVDRLRLFTRGAVPDDVRATPDPSARLGGPIVFTLVGSTRDAGGAPRAAVVGRAEADVRVSVPHAAAARLVTRGGALEGDAIEAADGEVAGVPLRPLPTAGDLAGATALRNLARGEVIAATDAAIVPAVRTGQTVRAVAHVGTIVVSATLVAAQNGDRGDVIRVVNKASRRELRARVTGEGTVEVIHD